jgi:hypothetical protein
MVVNEQKEKVGRVKRNWRKKNVWGYLKEMEEIWKEKKKKEKLKKNRKEWNLNKNQGWKIK